MAQPKQPKQEKYHTAWLLIAGTTDSPKNIYKVDRERGNGNYLHGIEYDLNNMKEAINHSNDNGTLANILQDMKYLECKTVLDRIKKAAREAQTYLKIYYTGHGQYGDGNLCFADGVISLDQVLSTARSESNCWIVLMLDSCWSGNWAAALKNSKYRGVTIQAASGIGLNARDTGKGGEFTLVKTGKNKYSDFPNWNACEGCMTWENKYTFQKWYSGPL